MDATVGDGAYLPSRTELVPDLAATLTYGWSRKVAEQTVRAAGLYGSVFVPFQVGQFTPTACDYELEATVRLPDNYFGTVNPPMIFPCVQYGSMVFYKQIEDRAHQIRYPEPGESFQPLTFRTYIDQLVCNDALYWSFRIRHVVKVSRGVGNPFGDGRGLDAPDGYIKDPYKDIGRGYWPDAVAFWAQDRGEVLHGVFLHWTAFGVNH
jgi:hypothetical protein